LWYFEMYAAFFDLRSPFLNHTQNAGAIGQRSVIAQT